MFRESISAFIVDDEFHSREVIRLLLERKFPEIKIAGQADNVIKAIEAIEHTQPNLLFLDVQLKNETGFDLLDKIQNINFEIIFTTAYQEFAVKAIRYSALDYLIKPIDGDEFQKAVEKTNKRIQLQKLYTNAQVQLLTHNLKTNKQIAGKLAIPTAEGLVFVTIGDIIYCSGTSNYTNIFTGNGAKLISSHTLKFYEEMLKDSGFFRVHKSYLINLSHIQKYMKGEGGIVIMSNGHEIEIARRVKAAFLNIFKA